MDIFQTSETKIVECYMRDYLKIDAFPIDRWVGRVLDKYGIPENSHLVVQCCNYLGIPIRPFARAVYDNGDVL